MASSNYSEKELKELVLDAKERWKDKVINDIKELRKTLWNKSFDTGIDNHRDVDIDMELINLINRIINDI